MLAWPEPCVQELARKLSSLGRLYFAWANVNEPGDRNEPHWHDPFFTAGVYYVAGGSGDLVFPATGERVTPSPGLCVLFPGDAYHLVEAARETRISVAFNFVGQRGR